jgi:hypothetical protein
MLLVITAINKSKDCKSMDFNTKDVSFSAKRNKLTACACEKQSFMIYLFFII